MGFRFSFLITQRWNSWVSHCKYAFNFRRNRTPVFQSGCAAISPAMIGNARRSLLHPYLGLSWRDFCHCRKSGIVCSCVGLYVQFHLALNQKHLTLNSLVYTVFPKWKVIYLELYIPQCKITVSKCTLKTCTFKVYITSYRDFAKVFSKMFAIHKATSNS